jgi:hypothetical protein
VIIEKLLVDDSKKFLLVDDIFLAEGIRNILKEISKSNKFIFYVFFTDESFLKKNTFLLF